MITYLTGATGEYLEQGLAHEYGIGLLCQPGNRYDLRAHLYPAWAADNGAFSKKGGFCAAKFRTMLARPGLQNNKATCLFVVAPDVLHVLEDGTVIGDAKATLEQFPQWAAEIRAQGFPVALVAQNGLESMLGEVPWDLVDVLFLGGSTEWKLSDAARACVAEARHRGKRTHMGRVNSYKRLKLADGWGVDTADGTFLAFGPTKNVPRLIAWLEKLGGTNGPNGVLGGTDQPVLGLGSNELAPASDGAPAQAQAVSAGPDGSGLPGAGEWERGDDCVGGLGGHSRMLGDVGASRPSELGHGNGAQVRGWRAPDSCSGFFGERDRPAKPVARLSLQADYG